MKTKDVTQPAIPLNDETWKRIEPAVMATWASIAPDVTAYCDDDNESALEAAMNPDHVAMYGDLYSDEEVSVLIRTLFRAHDYSTVLKWASTHVTLV